MKSSLILLVFLDLSARSAMLSLSAVPWATLSHQAVQHICDLSIGAVLFVGPGGEAPVAEGV